ncbi:hypothetical protein ACLB2K_022555 [Fragaria x ananassa]
MEEHKFEIVLFSDADAVLPNLTTVVASDDGNETETASPEQSYEVEEIFSDATIEIEPAMSHLRTNKEKELKSQKLRRILFARGILLQLGFPFHHGDSVSTWKPLSNRKSCFYKESKKRKSQILIQGGELVAVQRKAQSMDFFADF